MNRGVAKRVIFPDSAAKRRFLALLACSVRRAELEVEAFSIMDTHFHLLVRTPDGRIHYPMMRVLNAFARYFNRRFRRDGSPFRGRFRSVPVLTAAHWRILVRYIDSNPVRAGLCRQSADYPYGSARLYALRPGAPRWLARRAVEGHVTVSVGELNFRGRDYLRVFGDALSDGEAEVVERRLRGAVRSDDPFDQVLEMRPARIAAWMRRKAKLADGLDAWAPIVGFSAVRRHIRELRRREGSFEIRPQRNLWDGWVLLEVGLLHDIAGLGCQEIGRLIACAAGTAGRRLQLHRHALITDPKYASLVGNITRELLDATYPHGVPR